MKKIFLLSLSIGFYAIARCQNVGIGTTSPKAGLHVVDSSVLFAAAANLPATGWPAATGAGNRMMWYSAKAAIRAGGVSGTQWDEAAIGKYSAAFGFSNRAAGDYAASTGLGNSSSGIGSFTAGNSNVASGAYAAALGVNTDAQTYGSLVIGRYNILGGNSSTWVDSDPLFVVGNGYLAETSPGVVSIQRRNAFLIDKKGNATVGANATVNGLSTFFGEAQFKDTVRFNRNVGINLPASQTPVTSLVVNGAITLKMSQVTINAANDYTIDVANKGLVEVSYTEDYTIIPTIKLSAGGHYGQLLILTSSGGYSYKVAANATAGLTWITLPATRTISDLDTLMLIFLDGYWKELSYSNNTL